MPTRKAFATCWSTARRSGRTAATPAPGQARSSATESALRGSAGGAEGGVGDLLDVADHGDARRVRVARANRAGDDHLDPAHARLEAGEAAVHRVPGQLGREQEARLLA